MIRLFGAPVLRNKILLAAGDIAIVISMAWLAVVLRMDEEGAALYIFNNLDSFFLQALIYLVCFNIAALYDVKRDFRRLDQVLNILAACFFGMMFSVLFFYSRFTYIGRGIFFIYGALVFMFSTLMRSMLISLSSSQVWKKRVLIVGAGHAGRSLLNAILENHNCGLWVVGFVDDDPAKQRVRVHSKPVFGACSDLTRLVEEKDIDMIVLGITHKKDEDLVKVLIKCHYHHITIVDMPSVYESITGKLPLKHINDEWLLRSAMYNRTFMYKNLKRMMDILFSLGLLTLTSPIMLLSAVLIKVDSRGRVLFAQERVGLDYKKFVIYKFRTMVQDADLHTGPTSAEEDDPRITRVGRILRKFHIDELPQLFNVLKGNMSFVGPRPDIELFVNQLDQEIPTYGYRLVVRPGITGWAQVMYSYATTKEQFIEKLRYDLYYVKNMSILLDILIVLKTIRTVVLFKGR